MITPVDLENKEFGKSFRGYDIDEVETFLTELAKDYAKIYRENAGFKDKNAILTETIENYKNMEETMRSAIISAQKTSEDIIKNAHDQADNIIQEAKNTAAEEIAKMNSAVDALNNKCEEIQGRISMLRAKFRAMLKTHLSLLDEPDDGGTKVVEAIPEPEGKDVPSDATIVMKKIETKDEE